MDTIERLENARKYFTRDGRFIRTDAWKKEGRYVDLWSVVHVLSGIALAFYPRYFGFSVLATFIIVTLLFIMYEMFEVIVKIEEYPTNRVTDVLFGLVGFAPVYFVDQYLGSTTSIFLCGIATTIVTVVSIVGWSSSYKASVLEEKMRAEFIRERDLLRERRIRFAANRERRRRARRMRGQPH
ncbi:hypothetical protein HY971_04345 [Candidatus Kaiserbacteria bacterium]|nr:hypothetical protein [Candidatus Kaiserbacteria bacterium]